MNSKKLLIIAFFLQVTFFSLSFFISYHVDGSLNGFIPFPVSILIFIPFLIALPFSTIYTIISSVVSEIFFISFLIVIHHLIYKKDINKVERICNISFLIYTVSYFLTYLEFNTFNNTFSIIDIFICIFGIGILIFSEIVNSKYNKEEKITLDNAWKE